MTTEQELALAMSDHAAQVAAVLQMKLTGCSNAGCPVHRGISTPILAALTEAGYAVVQLEALLRVREPLRRR